jgi:hypothetical protein
VTTGRLTIGPYARQLAPCGFGRGATHTSSLQFFLDNETNTAQAISCQSWLFEGDIGRGHFENNCAHHPRTSAASAALDPRRGGLYRGGRSFPGSLNAGRSGLWRGRRRHAGVVARRWRSTGCVAWLHPHQAP